MNTTPYFTHFPTPLPLFPSYDQTNSPSQHYPKIQLLPFDGIDSLDWLFQTYQYFLYYLILLEQSLSLETVI